MRPISVAVCSIATLVLAACGTTEPPAREINHPAFASLGGERKICGDLVAALARRDRATLVSIMDSLPRTPGVPRDAARGADNLISHRDGVSISADIADIRPVGHGVVDGRSIYYFDVEFLRSNEPYLSTFKCELNYETGVGGHLTVGATIAKPKNTTPPERDPRTR